MTSTHEQADVAHRVEHAHPSARKYVYVAAILAALTACEVATSYLPRWNHNVSKWAIIAPLAILMVVKFSMVVMWFMHLRFDPRMFAVMFVGGLTLALVVFTAVMTIQRVIFV
jgi:cytochrome c oxidase subunit 4